LKAVFGCGGKKGAVTFARSPEVVGRFNERLHAASTLIIERSHPASGAAPTATPRASTATFGGQRIPTRPSRTASSVRRRTRGRTANSWTHGELVDARRIPVQPVGALRAQVCHLRRRGEVAAPALIAAPRLRLFRDCHPRSPPSPNAPEPPRWGPLGNSSWKSLPAAAVCCSASFGRATERLLGETEDLPQLVRRQDERLAI